MRKKMKVSLPLTIILLMIIPLMFSIGIVNATDYEWFDNGSFEDRYGTLSDPVFDYWDFSAQQGDFWANDTFAHTGMTSLGTYADASFSYYIGLLDSNYFTNITLWTYIDTGVSNDVNAKIRCRVYYSDYSSATTQYAETAVTDSWVKLDFTGAVTPDKYIVEIAFLIVDYVDTHIWDDFSLSATTQYGRCYWHLTPNPISSDLYHVSVYKGLSYTFHGTIVDVYGNIDEDGTFQILSDVRGVMGTGNVVNGLLSLTLPSHTTGLDETTSEDLNVSIIVDDTFFFEIEFTFVKSEADGNGNGLADGGFMATDAGSNLMLVFIFIVVPSMFLAMIMKSVGMPVIGFISGLGIMSSIGLKVGLVDIWFLFVVVLVIILMILAMMKRGMYT